MADHPEIGWVEVQVAASSLLLPHGLPPHLLLHLDVLPLDMVLLTPEIPDVADSQRVRVLGQLLLLRLLLLLLFLLLLFFGFNWLMILGSNILF